MSNHQSNQPKSGYDTAGAAKAIKRALPGITVFLFGILLPGVTLVTELSTGMAAAAFFDPIPTWVHVLLVALVPAGNFVVWYVVRYNKLMRPRWLSLLNGAVLGVSGFYTILFMPLTPIAIMMFWSGIGLLPLAPVFSFAAAVICRRHLTKHIRAQNLPHLSHHYWRGVVAALVLLIGVQLPTTLTHYGIQLAASSEAGQQSRGVSLLRNWGDEEELLRACYRRTGRIPDMISFLLAIGKERVMPETVQTIFYRVTGKPYNALPLPSSRQGGLWNPTEAFFLDRGRGGNQVAGIVKGLSLASSTLDGSVDADAALAYLEWTLVVNNTGRFAEEARMQLGLPADTTVSRVTLWVDGEPREAAFAGRAKVRQAYQAIVRKSRDPLLVTMSTPDTALVQMFPVPAGGQMKARIGITVPLQLQDASSAILQLPYIRERNHAIAAGVRHSLWIESRQQIRHAKGIGATTRHNGTYSLHGAVPDSVLGNVSPAIQFERNSDIDTVFTKDLNSPSVIQQRIHFEKQAFSHSVIVIDGSSTMRGYREIVASVIETLPADSQFTVVLAGDETIQLSADAVSYRQIADRIRKHAFEGGTDNVPALNMAWELAGQQVNGTILWIHGPQPVLLSSVDTLHNHWQRRPDRPVLFDLALGSGYNRIAEKLVDIPAIHTVPRIGDLKQDLVQQIEKLMGKQAWVRMIRTRDAASVNHAKQTSDHLARLWARDQVSHLIARGKPAALEKAIKIAQTYRIVTPVSGAVVLETSAQYKQASLEPGDAASVPTVPEPEEWALIIITLMVLTWLWFRKRAGHAALAA